MSDVQRRAGRSVGAVAALTLSATGFVALPAGASVNEDGTVTIDIAAISDFHGHIENAAQLDNMIKGIEASNPGDTIFAANGDLVGGSAFVSAIDNDNPTMDILTAMELDVSSTGNHEYDKGYDDLVDRIAARVGWPYLVANVTPIDNPPLAPYTILTTDSDVSVAFVGAVTEELPTLVSPAGIAGLAISDPVAQVDAQAALLKDGDPSNGEADIVVALIHETAGISKNAGADVDAVVAGHTHHEVEETTASGAPVIEPGDYGTAYGHFTLTYDKDSGTVVGSEASLVQVPAMYCEDDPAWDLPEKDRPKPEQLVTNELVCPLYKDARDKAELLGADPVGTIVGGADQGTNNGSDLGANRGTEMTGSNMIAQAFYEYSQSMSRQADFGIMNPGGVRASIDPNRDGTVTYQESFTAQPFGNDYGIVDITAAQVYTMLEQQWADASTQTSRAMLQLGTSDSLTYTYDVDAEFGSHIKQVFLNGELLDRDDTETLYAVASNSFLLAGGDGFNVFKDGVNYLATGIIDNDVFNDFLAANPGYVVDYAQRNIAISGEDALVAGAEATIDLASLSMTFATAQQPLPTAVELRLDATLVGEAAIDNTVTPNLNHTGAATVTFDVPADAAAGAHELTIVAGPTEMTIPVQIQAAPVDPAPAEGSKGNVLFAPDWASSLATHANTIAAADSVIVGDWNNDGVDTFALRTGNEYTFLATNRVDSAATTATLGGGSDAVVAGDFNGDGYDDLAIRTAGTNTFGIHLSADGTFSDTVDSTVDFGRVDDVALAGDWDGDGKDSLGVRRGAAFHLRNELAGGLADVGFTYGRVTDVPLVGDFDGDGADSVAVARDARVFVKNDLTGGAAASELVFGRASDERVVGDFFGTGTDTLAIVR